MFKTDLAYDNWKEKYRYLDETPIETWTRVAKTLASVEKKEDQEKWQKKFLETIVKFDKEGKPIGLKCTPGGRITANIGTEFKGATLINCYGTGPVKGATLTYTRESDDKSIKYPIRIETKDDGDDLINIFLTVMEQAKTLASEGGYGINFDFIRPRGSLIKGTGIEHPGIVAYMKVWDSVAECIVKGNIDGYVDKIKNYLGEETFKEGAKIVKAATRKGAMMGVLSCSHPDIEEFIRAKQTSGVLTKFNMSVAIDDKFMHAVEEDDFYELSFKDKVYKKIKARELYDLIMESTYNRAEPGIIFVDNMHKNNPIAYMGKANTTNPCGEIPILSNLTTVCLLGSLNLPAYVYIKDGLVFFDWAQFHEDIEIFTRMLDNVNDITHNALPSYDWATKNLRQIGMGINGLGSALMMLGIPYNSEEAVKFTKNICEMKENFTWKASADLAKEKGTFTAYDKKKFENTEYFKSARLIEATKNSIREYGVRNAKTTTYPPLGNTSVITDNTSNCIEPVYELEYERKKISNKWPEGLNQENVRTLLKHHREKDYEYWQGEYAGKKYYYEPHNRGLCEILIVRDYGYQWLLDNFPDKDHSKYLVTTKDLKVEDHINIQEVAQFYCNQSVSKTCNIPKDYPFKDFKNLYMEAWKRGLNGFTTYRKNTMESVFSDMQNARESKGIIKRDIKLPKEFLNGPTKVIKREGIKFYLHFSYLPDDKEMKFPIVLWIYTNDREKNASAVCNIASRKLSKLALDKNIAKEFVEATLKKAKEDYPHNRLGRMISLCLRHNIPTVQILTCLMGIEGDNVSTLLTAVRKFLGESLDDGTHLEGIKCERCGGDRVTLQSGCKYCLDCQFTGCG
jgi:ribonucleoside-diphosphate reductase alpha chain